MADEKLDRINKLVNALINTKLAKSRDEAVKMAEDMIEKEDVEIDKLLKQDEGEEE